MKFKVGDVISIPEYGIFKIIRIVTEEQVNDEYPNSSWINVEFLYEYDEIEVTEEYKIEYQDEIEENFGTNGKFFSPDSQWAETAFLNAPYQSPLWKVLNGEEL